MTTFTDLKMTIFTLGKTLRTVGSVALLSLASICPATVELRVGSGEAFATIQNAVDAVPATLEEPYIIYLKPGYYTETIVITGKKTSPVNTLTLTGDPQDFPTIDGGGTQAATVAIESQQNVILEHLCIIGAGGYGNVLLSSADHNTIRNSVIAANRRFDGITLSSSRFNLIENNVITQNARAGIFLINTSRENRIRFNLIVENSVGIQMAGQHSSEPFYENHNAFFGNLNGPVQGFRLGAGSVETAPDFVDRITFRLQPDSALWRWGIDGEATEQNPLPTRDMEGVIAGPEGFFYVDLSTAATRSYRDDIANDRAGGWTDQGNVDMRHIPGGEQVWGGIPFLLANDPSNTRSVVILKGAMATPWLPQSALNISVNESAQALTFLHATAWPLGEDVLRYVIHYADGRTLEIPVLRERQISDWFNPQPIGGATIAWSAIHPLHPQINAGLYAYTWNNPYPYVPIRSIDIVSEGKSTPIVAAITGHRVDPSLAVRVNLFADEGREYVYNKPIELSMDCISRSKRGADVVFSIYGEDGSELYQSEPFALELKTGLSEKMPFAWQPPASEQSEIYRFVATVWDGDQVLGSSDLHLRVQGKTATENPAPRLAVASRGDAPIGGDNLMYSCEIQPLVRVVRGQEPRRIDPIIFDQLKANGGTMAHLILWWGYLEKAPGEYDFSSVDWALEQCRRVGLKASLSIWMGDHTVPLFVEEENMLDQFGEAFLDGRGRVKNPSLHPSLWGPKTRDYYRNFIKTMAERYLDHEDVMGWAFMYQHIEVVIHDRPGSPPILYDYSTYAQDAYRDYLRDVRGFDLGVLNARYGTTFASWKDVVQPQPIEGIDVSLRWSDFQDFRIFSARESFRFTFDAVREIDPEGKKRVWVFMPEFSNDLTQEYDIITNFCASEAPYAFDRFLAWNLNSNRQLIVEPITIPPGVYEIGSGFFNALSTPAQGYLWVGTDRHLFDPDSPAAGLYKRYRDAWVELSQAQAPRSDFAIYRSEETAMATDKVFCNYPSFQIGSNYEWLVKRLLGNQYNYQPVYGAHLNQAGNKLPYQFRLILDTDSAVMREAQIEEMLSQTWNGATWVITPQTGRYMRENPEPEHSLAARIGWPEAASAAWKPVGGSVTLANTTSEEISGGTSAASLFASSRVRFIDTYPIDRLSAGELVRAADGSSLARVLPYGEGQIVMLAGMVDWKDDESASLLYSLTNAVGIKKPVFADTNRVRCRTVEKDGDTYLLLFNEESTLFTQATVSLHLEDGDYHIVNITDSLSDCGNVTTDELNAKGYQVTLAPLELRVLRFSQR